MYIGQRDDPICRFCNYTLTIIEVSSEILQLLYHICLIKQLRIHIFFNFFQSRFQSFNYKMIVFLNVLDIHHPSHSVFLFVIQMKYEFNQIHRQVFTSSMSGDYNNVVNMPIGEGSNYRRLALNPINSNLCKRMIWQKTKNK